MKHFKGINHKTGNDLHTFVYRKLIRTNKSIYVQITAITKKNIISVESRNLSR